MKFGIQGERGCHSHVALLGLKQKAVDYKCYADFKSLFQGLMDGHVEQVIVPLENSISGTFFQILDSIMQLKLFIVDEYQTRDEHCLAAVAGSDAIVEVQSHPYVFDQCSSFLSTIGSAKVIQTLDTASAARTISRQNQPNIAAIVSPMCAKLYNLEIIKNVADDSDSITRYVFVSKKQGDNPERHENPRTSLCVVLKNQTGSLERAIACFSHRDLNLSKLESRPSSRAIKVFENNSVFQSMGIYHVS
jgi:prephenate dehydratase